MNIFSKKTIGLVWVIVLFFACETPSNNNTPTTSSSNKKTPIEQPTSKTPTPTKPKDCEIKGKMLEGNRKLVKDLNTLVCIVADSTKETNHRVLEIYNTTTCELIKREILPINFKLNFPYQIADIIYNKNSHLVAMKSYREVYCYDVEHQNLLKPLVPDFLNERIAADAQSGSIQHLEVWENYLIGYVRDGGAFVFDVSDTENPKVLLPAAEYDLSMGEGEDFSSLFFLKSENQNTYQAIAPTFDYDENKFQVNALFETPKNMNINIPKNVSDNRFVILKNQDGNTFAIDMESQKNVALPDQIKNQPTKDILKWLKK